MSNQKVHTSVLLKESIDLLNIKSDGFYIDCTLGEAGHSLNILKRLSPDGLLLSIEYDKEAFEFVKSQNSIPSNWIIVNDNFKNIDSILKSMPQELLNRKPDGILFDLGISSRHLDLANTGISYNNDSDPLDMRVDSNLEVKAVDLLRVLSKSQLSELIFRFGEERNARKISEYIKRDIDNISSVGDLKRVISKAIPAGPFSLQAIRRVFQALRIAVNDELGNLQLGLTSSLNILNSKGRVVVISFHSLEDRIVKNTFQQAEKENKGKIITSKPMLPSESELNENSRSHSAKLRCFEID